jgi:hypothetical protein
MLRKVLLVLMAVVISYGLTAFAGYILYASGEGWSEAHLSIVIRFIESPLIAVLIGSLVGFLSKDRPIPTSIIGLAPWTILLLSSPNKPVSISGWLSWLAPILVYAPLGATAAVFAWRYRHKSAKQSGSLA